MIVAGIPDRRANSFLVAIPAFRRHSRTRHLYCLLTSLGIVSGKSLFFSILRFLYTFRFVVIYAKACEICRYYIIRVNEKAEFLLALGRFNQRKRKFCQESLDSVYALMYSCSRKEAMIERSHWWKCNLARELRSRERKRV